MHAYSYTITLEVFNNEGVTIMTDYKQSTIAALSIPDAINRIMQVIDPQPMRLTSISIMEVSA